MSRVAILRVSVLFAFVGLVALVTDVVIVTDEERLEEFVDGLDGEVDDAWIDRALAYVDPVQQPVEVELGGQKATFGDGDETELASVARDTLSPFVGSDVRLVQDEIEMDSDRARVAIRASTREGLVDAQFHLERHGSGWLVSRVHVN